MSSEPQRGEMGKEYPIRGKPTEQLAEHRFRVGFPCDKCKMPFQKGETIAVIETQVNWFRGDDEVEFYHKQCKPKQCKPKDGPQ